LALAVQELQLQVVVLLELQVFTEWFLLAAVLVVKTVLLVAVVAEQQLLQLLLQQFLTLQPLLLLQL
jgi:hypothetical protein